MMAPTPVATLQPMIAAWVNGRSSRILITCSAGQTTHSENVPIRAIWLTGSPLSLTRVVPQQGSARRAKRLESSQPSHAVVFREGVPAALGSPAGVVVDVLGAASNPAGLRAPADRVKHL